MGHKKLTLQELDDAHDKRKRIHAHNRLLGNVAMARSNMEGIMRCETATRDAYDKANNIIQLLYELHDLVKERVDK